MEESLSIPSAGFPLNDHLFQMIIRRYSDENGNMDFDNYIGCLVRLDAMCRTFVCMSELLQGTLSFFQSFIVLFFYAGAFQTLDKDKNGTIKINVQEVIDFKRNNRFGFHHLLTDLLLFSCPSSGFS